MGNRSLGRNDAPVLTIAFYLFIQEPKFDVFIIFFLKRNSEIVQRPLASLRAGLRPFKKNSVDITWLRTSFCGHIIFVV